jgi:ABC-type uncharacterized transport system fused permease/ATPase subunit
LSLGDVAQATAAFITVQTALNWLVDNYPAVADCLSSINRVASLLIAIDEFERGDQEALHSRNLEGSSGTPGNEDA